MCIKSCPDKFACPQQYSVFMGWLKSSAKIKVKVINGIRYTQKRHTHRCDTGRTLAQIKQAGYFFAVRTPLKANVTTSTFTGAQITANAEKEKVEKLKSEVLAG